MLVFQEPLKDFSRLVFPVSKKLCFLWIREKTLQWINIKSIRDSFGRDVMKCTICPIKRTSWAVVVESIDGTIPGFKVNAI